MQFAFGGALGIVKTALPILNMARIAFLFLARGVMQAGMMMLANPLVLAIVAIGVAIGTLAYLIYANWAKISGAFTTGFNYVKGLLAAAPAWMKSLGSMMMQGLLAALNPMLLANRLLSIARTGITAFKQFFGIKSPSRLFMEMGGHMTSGLAIGVDQGGRQPLRSMGDLAGRMAGAGDPGSVSARLTAIAQSGAAALSSSQPFNAVGARMGSGLATGIDRAGDQSRQSIAAIAEQLLGAANPSLLTKRVLNMAQGGMSALKALLRDDPSASPLSQMGGARNVTAPGRTMARGGAARRGSGGPTAAPLTIQIFQQPGESADTLANRVVQMLEAKQRTARLSSYSDDF